MIMFGRKQGSSSFLKKRTKKLLLPAGHKPRSGDANKKSKSFLVLFFKKELLLLTVPYVSACAVGPDFHKPTPPTAAAYRPGKLTLNDQAQRFVKGMDIPGQWWALFHSAQLNALIERALAANPSLEAAQAALRQAREQTYAEEGSFFPTIEGNFTPSRTKTATRSVSIASANGSPYYSLYTAQLEVSYSPDLFGGTRRQVENLVATADQQRFQLEATYLTLTSNLVTACINEASLRDQIEATRQIISLESDLLSVLNRQYALGQIAQVDVLAQQAALAQAKATLPPLQKQLDQQRDALAALIGAPPDRAIPETFRLADIALPANLPVSLPASLVDQRPDVRQAEANLRAASALVGVAIANRLPVLNLTAQGGTQANYFTDMFASGNGFWVIAASLTQPIFDGGTLLHRARAAWAALDQAKAQYRTTALAAFQNVADCLAALQADADSISANAQSEQAAAASLRIVRLQVSLGQIAYLGILNAQQTALQAQISLVQAKASRLADTAALFQALGGGWWNRNDVHVRDVNANDTLGVLGVK
jgi:NodT family efflux transporter outer membrane factor (OMF) lipoprotein